jgi:hypothetical protein
MVADDLRIKLNTLGTLFAIKRNNLGKMSPSRRVAVITPFDKRKYSNSSQLFPNLFYPPARKWDYYHRCLTAYFRVDYFDIDHLAGKTPAGYDYVFVHELLCDVYPYDYLDVLHRLKKSNGKVAWVELHEKTLYSWGMFEKGFFEVVDLVLKHQLVDFTFLKDALSRPDTCTLAPYRLFGCNSIVEYYSDKRLFSFRFSETIFEKHLQFDFEASGDRILPIMFPFSPQYIDRVKMRDVDSSYIEEGDRTYFVSYAGRDRSSPAHAQRFVVADALNKALGGRLHYLDDYRHALQSSSYFLSLGHIHSSLRTFDNLLVDTGMIHYDLHPYRMFLDLREFVNYVPIGNPHRIFPNADAEADLSYLQEIVDRAAEHLVRDGFLPQLLVNQKRLLEQIIDPEFILSRIGVEVNGPD